MNDFPLFPLKDPFLLNLVVESESANRPKREYVLPVPKIRDRLRLELGLNDSHKLLPSMTINYHIQ
jgi:hypothetical protein